MNKVAIVGAGLCGAAAAIKLLQADYQVTVFDKGRSVGGRMSSKRTEAGYVDMGAQYFTARNAQFQYQVQLWLEAGCADVWCCGTTVLTSDGTATSLQASPDQQLRYIGVPSMQSPVKFLLSDVSVITGCRIVRLQREKMNWCLFNEAGECYSDFDAVVLTMPPVQTEQLLAQSGLSGLFAAPPDILEPCWAVAVYAAGVVQSDAVFCEHPKLRFVSHQGNKLGRRSCYVLHFNACFSRDHMEQPAEFWFREASNILRSELGVEGAIDPVVAHRWLYASQNAQLASTGLVALPDQQIWIGGDWSYGGRVENAYLSGLDLASALMHHKALIS
jgi:renalase